MVHRNRFFIRNDLSKALTLNVEPEGAFFALPDGKEVSITEVFKAAPVTIKLSPSNTGDPIVSIWPGDGEVKVEKDGVDVLELIETQRSDTGVNEEITPPLTANVSKRVFIFGSGFSAPAGLPVATKLLPALINELEIDEMREWLDETRKRLAWLSESDQQEHLFALSIEEIFHYAHFDIEVHRLRQHLAPVGRRDGPGTPWNDADSVKAWLSYLLEALRDVIFKCDEKADLTSIKRWAENVSEDDAVLTFNYDTLVERALESKGRAWNHGTGRDQDKGVPVFKLHGSIDWIVADRKDSPSNLELLFEKKNLNRSKSRTGHIEEDYRLWRCKTREQLRKWIEGRDVQRLPEGVLQRTVGIAGLGAYKEVHQIPGLGHVWTRGMRSLYEADLAVVVGFSMSDFDAMAKMQFADVVRARVGEGRPLPVVVIDPMANEALKARFRNVFRFVHLVRSKHEEIDWSTVSYASRH